MRNTNNNSMEGPIDNAIDSIKSTTPTGPRRVPGSGIARSVPSQSTLARPSRPAGPTRPLGGGIEGRPLSFTTPSFDFSAFVKQFSRLTFTSEVPKRWHHLSVIALAVLVAAITIDSKSLATPARPGIGGSEATVASATQTRANFDLSLPSVKSIQLPPVPVKNEGVKDPYIASSNAILVDNESKLPLYEKGADQRIAVASTTKVMAALMAYEMYKDRLDQPVKVSARAAGQIGSAVGFRIGETATIRQLLYGLMLPSGNDAAEALAELSLPEGGVVARDHFMNEMNKFAKRLGMENSHFLSPSGLDDGGYSTASDMAKAMGALVKNPELTKVVGTLDYQYTSPEGFLHTFKNSNRLLAGGEMPYRGMIGGKTGFTPKTPEGGAGHCLIVAAERDGHTLIAAVFDTYSHTPQASAQVSRDLLDYGFNNFTWQTVNR